MTSTATDTTPTVGDLLTGLTDVRDCGVFFSDEFVSWHDHLRDAATLAATLRDRLDPDRPPHVGVLLDNTPTFSAMLVASGLYGIVPVGLNPIRRGEALARDIRHADCQLVLVDSRSAPASVDGIDHVDVGSAAWAEELAAHRDDRPAVVDATADDLFMLIFTSGTGGKPKAVKCSHGKVAFAGSMIADQFGLGVDDRCYVSMPLFHSNAILVGWGVAIACRGSMVLRRKFSASEFFTDVRKYGVTYANYVGKPLSYVLATPERRDDADNTLRLLYGNEGAPADVERFSQRFGCVAVDAYGSTEGALSISRTADTPAGALGPLTNGVDVIDIDTGEPCPPGVVGELVNTRGRGAFEGYYNDAYAESERLADGTYHSGDLAYRDENGFVFFAGRLGDWMRVDGENLGTAPIEQILLRHKDIVEAVVYPIPDPAVGDQVMAALVPVTGAELYLDDLEAFLAAQTDLGPKQWPAYIRVSSELPRTATFKVIKRTLTAQATTCDDTVWRVRRPGSRSNG